MFTLHKVEHAVTQHYNHVSIPQQHRETLESLAVSAADDSKQTTAKLRASLRAQLTELDHQEDRFLDLIGDPDWPQDKIKTRLQKVRESKQRITHQLENTTDDLEPGRAVLLTALELLDRPHDLYDTATEDARKMLNKAIFTRLYLNSTDRQPTATAATLSEPFASLVHATRATDGTKTPQTHTAAEEDITKRLSDLLTTALAGQSASKDAMVDLLAAYSKQVDRVSELVSAVERLRIGGVSEPVRVSVRSADGTRMQQRVMDRLGEAGVRRLASEFRAGVTTRELAERYAMSQSTVKRILRKRGTRRNAPAA